MALLYGRAGRLTTKNGDSWPRQSSRSRSAICASCAKDLLLKIRPGPPWGGYAPLAFPIENQFCVAFLYGRAGRLTPQNGGFRPGQGAEPADASEENPVIRAPPVPNPDRGRKKLRSAANAAAAVAGFRAGTPVRQREGHSTVPPALHGRMLPNRSPSRAKLPPSQDEIAPVRQLPKHW